MKPNKELCLNYATVFIEFRTPPFPLRNAVTRTLGNAKISKVRKKTTFFQDLLAIDRKMRKIRWRYHLVNYVVIVDDVVVDDNDVIYYDMLWNIWNLLFPCLFLTFKFVSRTEPYAIQYYYIKLFLETWDSLANVFHPHYTFLEPIPLLFQPPTNWIRWVKCEKECKYLFINAWKNFNVYHFTKLATLNPRKC